MKKYNFLNINPSNIIVLKFHMLLLYIYHLTVSKQCFLVGESRYQSCIFSSFKKAFFWQKSHFFIEFYSQHILISLHDPSNER